jgi:hypothetical protein
LGSQQHDGAQQLGSQHEWQPHGWLNSFFSQAPIFGRQKHELQQGSQHGAGQPQAGSAWQPQVGAGAQWLSQPHVGWQPQVASQPQPQPPLPPHRPSSKPALALEALQHRAITATAKARLIMGGS